MQTLTKFSVLVVTALSSAVSAYAQSEIKGFYVNEKREKEAYTLQLPQNPIWVLGRGVVKRGTDESIALVCNYIVHDRCRRASLAYFKGPELIQRLGHSIDMPEAPTEELFAQALEFKIENLFAYNQAFLRDTVFMNDLPSSLGKSLGRYSMNQEGYNWSSHPIVVSESRFIKMKARAASMKHDLPGDDSKRIKKTEWFIAQGVKFGPYQGFSQINDSEGVMSGVIFERNKTKIENILFRSLTPDGRSYGGLNPDVEKMLKYQLDVLQNDEYFYKDDSAK